jgi:hypothetical protein
MLPTSSKLVAESSSSPSCLLMIAFMYYYYYSYYYHYVMMYVPHALPVDVAGVKLKKNAFYFAEILELNF